MHAPNPTKGVRVYAVKRPGQRERVVVWREPLRWVHVTVLNNAVRIEEDSNGAPHRKFMEYLEVTATCIGPDDPEFESLLTTATSAWVRSSKRNDRTPLMARSQSCRCIIQ